MEWEKWRRKRREGGTVGREMGRRREADTENRGERKGLGDG